MQIPLVKTTVVRVPYLSPLQTPAITRAINRLVHEMMVSTAQGQAVCARIVIVRTVPLNVLGAFASTANTSAL